MQYSPDEPNLLVKQLRHSFSDGLPTFVTGGIDSTPDDHTRQAAAATLDLPVARHPGVVKFIEDVTLKRSEPLNALEYAQRPEMTDFPVGAELMPNPFNNIAGFLIHGHYFFPSFLVMAHPMAEWVLDTYYTNRFDQTERDSRSMYVFGQPKSRVTPIMEYVERTYPGVRSYGPPNVGWQNADRTTVKPHIKFGIKTEGVARHDSDGAWGEVPRHLRDMGAELKDKAEWKQKVVWKTVFRRSFHRRFKRTGRLKRISRLQLLVAH